MRGCRRCRRRRQVWRWGREVVAKAKPVRFDKLEAGIFADALGDGDSVARAAKRAGRSARDGEAWFARICDKFGWQAR